MTCRRMLCACSWLGDGFQENQVLLFRNPWFCLGRKSKCPKGFRLNLKHLFTGGSATSSLGRLGLPWHLCDEQPFGLFHVYRVLASLAKGAAALAAQSVIGVGQVEAEHKRWLMLLQNACEPVPRGQQPRSQAQAALVAAVL